MVTVSNDFRSALRSGAKQDIRLEFASGEVIDKSRISASGGFQYQQYFNQDGDLQMGTAIMSTIEVSLINHDGYFGMIGLDFTEECTVKYGVMVNGSYEYVSLGIFKGDRVDHINSNVIRYTANDRMALFEKDASAFIEGLTFPVSINQIYHSLCAFVGVESETTEQLTNGHKTFEANPFDSSDYTCREVLAWIAEAACSYAMIDRNGKAKMAWFSRIYYTILKSERFNLALSETMTPMISKLEVYTSYSDMLNTCGSGGNLYVISDNPFLYAENETDKTALQPYVNAIYDKLAGIPRYFPMSFRALTNPAIESGDIITVALDGGRSDFFPVFSQTIRWNGNGKTEYENTGNAKRENVPIAQRELENIKKKMLKNTDLSTSIDSYLNTAEGKAGIVSAVEGKFVTADDLGGYVTTAKLTQEISAVDSKISLETAVVGDGTIASNVKAMLTLFADADSSKIKLNADAIDLSGYVTIKSLAEPNSSTEIDGSNIKTSSITADKLKVGTLSAGSVLLNSETRSTTVLRSDELAGNLTVYLGIEEEYKDGDMELAQYLRIYGTEIYFQEPGSGEAITNALVVNTYHKIVFPYDGRWSLGGKIRSSDTPYYFNEIYGKYFCFDDDSYIRVYNGRLQYVDADGNKVYIT